MINLKSSDYQGCTACKHAAIDNFLNNACMFCISSSGANENPMYVPPEDLENLT